jgi:hypothetical protein
MHFAFNSLLAGPHNVRLTLALGGAVVQDRPFNINPSFKVGICVCYHHPGIYIYVTTTSLLYASAISAQCICQSNAAVTPGAACNFTFSLGAVSARTTFCDDVASCRLSQHAFENCALLPYQCFPQQTLPSSHHCRLLCQF